MANFSLKLSKFEIFPKNYKFFIVVLKSLRTSPAAPLPHTL